MPPLLGQLGEVAVAPDAREALEIGSPGSARRPGRSRTSPACRGTAWCRPARPSRRATGRPCVVPDVDREAEAAHLDLAAAHRARRIAEHEAGDDVGAARDRGELHVRLDRLDRRSRSSPAPAASRSRGSPASGARSCVCAGASPAFLQASMYLALVPKTSTRSRSRDVPEHRGRRVERRAVEQHQRLLDREPADQPVPHHPAAGGEVEHAARPGAQSVCSRCSLMCCSSVPPAPCTIALGLPVVPEE